MNKKYPFGRSVLLHVYRKIYCKWILWTIFVFVCIAVFLLGYGHNISKYQEETLPQVDKEQTLSELSRRAMHIGTPEAVRGVYMSSWVAGVPELRSKIINLIDTTELNAVVIDVKDSSGVISFQIPGEEFIGTTGGQIRIADIENLIAELHSKDIYVIGRVAVFQDTVRTTSHSELAIKSKKTNNVWKDSSRLAWIDPAAEDQWRYVEKIGKYAYSIGFDEINLDYVRYPSDGELSDMYMPISIQGTETKEQVITRFFEYIGKAFRVDGVPTSVDIFGLTTMRDDDMGIGQKLEAALYNFDYVSPMTYPSHYGEVFTTFSNPNAHPGETITESYIAALRKIDRMSKQEAQQEIAGVQQLNIEIYNSLQVKYKAKLRPWYQDFSYGYPYGTKEVRQQIDAGLKLGIESFLLWNPKNVYTRDALTQTHE